MLLVSLRLLLELLWGISNMLMKDVHTNRYKRKRQYTSKHVNIFGTIFDLVVVGAYFVFMLYILCFIHQIPVTYP